MFGFESLSGVMNMAQTFTSLETIWAYAFTNAITSLVSTFYGCNRLVGGHDGFVSSSTSAGSVCKLGADGVLTDPFNDNREWFKVFLYDDGMLNLTVLGTADSAKTLLDSGRMRANAKYQAVGVILSYSYRVQFRTVSVRADMGTLSAVNMTTGSTD